MLQPAAFPQSETKHIGWGIVCLLHIAAVTDLHNTAAGSMLAKLQNVVCWDQQATKLLIEIAAIGWTCWMQFFYW